jgi:N-acetylglutamate synthase-like GNAT family acetyltransferase
VRWPQFVLAVTADDQIIGCGQVKSHNDGSRELASIAVVPEWRKQAIASRIITHLMATHVSRLWLTCSSEMIPFYQKFGFGEIKEPAHMSPYFRRIFRFSQWLVWLMRSDRYLAVMLWQN